MTNDQMKTIRKAWTFHYEIDSTVTVKRDRNQIVVDPHVVSHVDGSDDSLFPLVGLILSEAVEELNIPEDEVGQFARDCFNFVRESFVERIEVDLAAIEKEEE